MQFPPSFDRPLTEPLPFIPVLLLTGRVIVLGTYLELELVGLLQSQFRVITVNLQREVIMQFPCPVPLPLPLSSCVFACHSVDPDRTANQPSHSQRVSKSVSVRQGLLLEPGSEIGIMGEILCRSETKESRTARCS